MKTITKILAGSATTVVGLAAMGAYGAAAEIESLDATTSERTVIRWIDGDSVETDGGPVRLIGIDAPELKNDRRCNDPGKAALEAAEAAAPAGSTVTLYNPASVDNKDRYGRRLRYVYTGWADVGEDLVREDLADARYDSRDGYNRHPKEDKYRDLDPAGHPQRKRPCEAIAAPAPTEDSHDYPEPDNDHHPLLWWLLLRDGNKRYKAAVESDSSFACSTLEGEARDAAGLWFSSDERDKVAEMSRRCEDDRSARETAEREAREVQDAAERGARDGRSDGQVAHEARDDTGHYAWDRWPAKARTAYSKAYNEAYDAAESERKAAEAAREAAERAEAAKYHPDDSDRDGTVTEFERENAAYGRAWDRYLQNPTEKNRILMEEASRRSSEAAVREIDPSYTGSGGGGGGDGGYTGPRCYAPGGTSWTPC